MGAATGVARSDKFCFKSAGRRWGDGTWGCEVSVV